MSHIVRESVRGALKVTGLLDREQFVSWRDFLENGVPRLLSVEVPTEVSNVIVGNKPPSDDDKDKMWFRRDGSGNFLGLYAFQNGGWRPFYNFAQGQIIWMSGNSSEMPEGFVLIEEGDATLPDYVVKALFGQYVGNGAGGFAYFAARFAGY